MKRFGFVFALLFTACATAPSSKIADLPAGKARWTASDESTGSPQTPGSVTSNSTPASSAPATPKPLEWIAHPCHGQKGVAFNSYFDFAYDEAKQILYGHKKQNGPLVVVPAQGGQAWGSVEAFFQAQRLHELCGSNASTNPPAKPVDHGGKPPRPPKQDREDGEERAGGGDYNPKNEAFVAPVNFDTRHYYAAFYADTRDVSVKAKLHAFLARPHMQAEGQDDRVVDSCPTQPEQGAVCVNQHFYTYQGARKIMFGALDLRKKDDGQYEVFDYYCDRWRDDDEFHKAGVKDGQEPAPDRIPSAQLMNTEHTWPQSKFTAPKGSRENLIQKTDLHHIFPTDTKDNALRSNYEFADVDRTGAKMGPCQIGVLGPALPVAGLNEESKTVFFEPPPHHKGNVARALMYFSTRYNGGMSATQEASLRRWNHDDPPDDMEIARNEKIYRMNGVRNPFVDDPSLADKITRFCREKLEANQASYPYECQ